MGTVRGFTVEMFRWGLGEICLLFERKFSGKLAKHGNFHALVAFMIILLSSYGGGPPTRHLSGHWPRHFLRQGKLRRENRAAVTIMEENIDLIFSLRRAAFLLLHPVLHGPRWEHLFTRSGISGDEKSRTHKKHKKNRNFTKKTKISLAPRHAQANIFPVATFQHRLQQEKKHPSESVRVPGNRFLFEATAANEKWLLLLLTLLCEWNTPVFSLLHTILSHSLTHTPQRRHPRV